MAPAIFLAPFADGSISSTKSLASVQTLRRSSTSAPRRAAIRMMRSLKSRYLADENIPAPTILALRSAGFDVAAISEIAAGSPDQRVLTIARDQGRILLSFALDVGALIFERRLPAPTGVLLIRDIPHGLSDTTSLVIGLLQRQDLILPETSQ
jgi:hypothetical protein